MSSENFYLKEGLSKLNISREKLQNDLKVSQPYISNLLNGKKSIGGNMAQKLSQLYNLNINWLLTGKGEILNGDSNIQKLEINQEVNKEKNTPFNRLPIEDKLNYIFEENKKIEALHKKIEELEEKIDIYRTRDSLYLKAIIAHLGIDEIEDVESQKDYIRN